MRKFSIWSLCALLLALWTVAALSDTAPDETPPVITLGLAGSSATSVNPFPPSLTVSPDSRGRIVVRARLTDAIGETYAAMTAFRASSTMLNSPAKTNYISISVDCRNLLSGTKLRWTVDCADAAGNTSHAEVELTLQK